MPRTAAPNRRRPDPAGSAPGRRPHDGAATREALLDAAVVEFAREGYRDAGLREIAARAGTKTGNVHYHFGGKRALYRQAFVRANERLFDEAGVPVGLDGLEPRAALRRWVGFALRMILLRRPKHAAGRMLAFELRDPSDALTEMVKLVFVPVRGELERVVGAALAAAGGGRDGPAADPPDRAELRARATDDVLALVVLYQQHVPMLQRFGRPIPRTEAEVDNLADSVASFAWGGIHQLANDAGEPDS